MAGFLTTKKCTLDVSDNYIELCERTTQRILEFTDEKIAKQGQCTIVLSGGETPRGVYQSMVSPDFRDKFKWTKIHFFFSDERWVPWQDVKSNYGMAQKELFSKVGIPLNLIHPIQTDNCTLQASACMYEDDIRNFFKLESQGFPRFDLILLGLGQDGHVASLLPGNPVLWERDRLVIDVSDKAVPEQRVSITIPVIDLAQMIVFLVSGASKANAVHQVLENDEQTIFPASRLNPISGETFWFLDKDAVSSMINPGAFLRIPHRIGLAADHAGYALKEDLSKRLTKAGFEVIDFGDRHFNPNDDFPDFALPLAQAVGNAQVDRGIAVCGSGVGMCIAANKVAGVRACLINEKFSAHQGVEDDDMNIICLGSNEINSKDAWNLVSLFLAARYTDLKRHQRRLNKVAALEKTFLK